MQDHDIYAPEFLAMLQSIWGEGYLSPGGDAEVAEILSPVPVAGKRVLDIGSGLGGPAFHILETLGAASVVGTEVQAPLVDAANRIAEGKELRNRVEFLTVSGGELPFEERSFDIVFSKDSIIHVSDKKALYGEIRRVLKPGGWLAMSDWFGGTAPVSKDTEEWLEATGLTFALKPIGETAGMLRALGYRQVTTKDRNAWYAELARLDVERLEGEAGERLAMAIGAEAAAEWRERSRKRALVAEQGHLRPGHIHAVN